MDNKDRNAKKAEKHMVEMGKYSSETQQSVQETIIYGYPNEGPVLPWADNRKPPEIHVINADSVSAILNNSDGKTAVLNFASYKNPGGGFLNGAMAQEEALCHESNLYNILNGFKFSFYAWNINHVNQALYANRALYTPDVVFERDGVVKKVDVITCAAPNYAVALNKYDVSREKNIEVMRSRIDFIKCIAEENGVETLILGAFGCGVFRQDPYQTAYLFQEIFAYCGYVKKLIFAIPFGANLDAFKSVFDNH